VYIPLNTKHLLEARENALKCSISSKKIIFEAVPPFDAFGVLISLPKTNPLLAQSWIRHCVQGGRAGSNSHLSPDPFVVFAKEPRKRNLRAGGGTERATFSPSKTRMMCSDLILGAANRHSPGPSFHKSRGFRLGFYEAFMLRLLALNVFNSSPHYSVEAIACLNLVFYV